jgi:uncharacterized protein YjcR
MKDKASRNRCFFLWEAFGMGRNRSPNRDKAFEIYKEHKGNISPKDLAEQLKEKIECIYRWKTLDEWDYKIHKKKGAPKGNNRAVGNRGGAAPKGNKNARKTEKKKSKGGQKGNLNGMKNGLYCDFSKRLPEDFIKKWFPIGLKKAYEDSVNMGISKLDKLGHSIDMLWSRILVSQKITQVKSKNDMTKELKREKNQFGKNPSIEKEYEIQFAWDKENSSLDTYSKAMERLTNMIDKYEKLLHANWDLATEEQKLRIDKIKADLSKGNKSDEPINIVISRKHKES